MKKKKPIITPALLPSKKKEMLKLVNDPKKLESVMDFINASSNLFEKSKHIKASTLLDWEERCIDILPDDLVNRDKFIEDFKNFIDNYGEISNGTSNE